MVSVGQLRHSLARVGEAVEERGEPSTHAPLLWCHG